MPSPAAVRRLEAEHGQVWDTQELRAGLHRRGLPGTVRIVRRKSDGQRGSLMFQHDPRFYFSFQPHQE